MKRWVCKTFSKSRIRSAFCVPILSQQKSHHRNLRDVFLESQTQTIIFLEKSLRGMPWEDVIYTFMVLLSEGWQMKWISPAQLAIRSDRGLCDVREHIDNIADRFTLCFEVSAVTKMTRLFENARITILLLDAFATRSLGLQKKSTQGIRHSRKWSYLSKVILQKIKYGSENKNNPFKWRNDNMKMIHIDLKTVHW